MQQCRSADRFLISMPLFGELTHQPCQYDTERERDDGPVYRCRFGGWEAGDKVTSLFANRHLFHPPQCCTVFSFAHKFSFLSLLFKTYRLKVTRNHTGRAGTENCLCIAVNQRRHGTDAKGHLVNIVWDTSCGVWCPGNENGLIKSLTMCWERKSIAVTYHIIVFVACEILYNYQQMFLFCTHICFCSCTETEFLGHEEASNRIGDLPLLLYWSSGMHILYTLEKERTVCTQEAYNECFFAIAAISKTA